MASVTATPETAAKLASRATTSAPAIGAAVARSNKCPASETGGKQVGKPPGTSSQIVPLSQPASVSREQKHAGFPIWPGRQTLPSGQLTLPSSEQTTPSPPSPPQLGVITSGSAKSAIPDRILLQNLA